MAKEENIKKARLFFESSRNRPKVLGEIFADDIKWWIPKGAIGDYPGEHKGKQKVISMICEASSGAFVSGTQSTEIILEVADEKCVVLEAIVTADTTVGFRYTNTYVFIFKFDEDGLIHELREHVDTHIARQLFGKL